MQHLSTFDAAFLHLESPETPMHVGSLMLFELPPGYSGDYCEDVRALIAGRMHLISAFRRKLTTMPFELADPVWVEDDDIDLDYHVRHITLRKPGTMEQLEQTVARLHSTLLDRSRPLWELVVIDGLANGQVATYTKAHHSGIDGQAGVELSKILYDLKPEGRAVPPPRRRHRPSTGYPLGMAELMRAGLSNSFAKVGQLARMVPKGARAVAMAARVVATRRAPEGGRSLNIGLAPRTMFNVPVTNQRSFATMSLPLDEIKALGARVGGTVNTIVMAMCAGALRRFIAEREPLPAKGLVAAVPVSLRAAGDASANNQVSAVRVDLATDLADPGERFKAIHASSEGAKAVVRELKPVLGLDLPLIGSPWLLSGLTSVAVRSGLLNRLQQFANVLISNVPGIPVPLYLAGARMVHFYPVSIPFHSMGVNITVQSYAGLLEFGVTACRRVLSQEESHELLGYMRETLEQIRSFGRVPDDAAAARSAPPVAEPAGAAAPDDAPARAALQETRPPLKVVAGAAPTRRPARAGKAAKAA